MNENPLVSVIMPAYNAERFISEAIESVLKQTYDNIELVIVDDASTDNTRNIIRMFSDNRINILFNRKNMGIAYSTNKCIENSHGKYIALLDDDDVAFPNRIKYQVDFLEENVQFDILGGRTAIIDESGSIINYGSTPKNNPKYIKAVLLFNCVNFMNGTAMIRRSFINKFNLKYEDNCYGMQDYKFYIEASKVGNITTLDKFFLKHRLHDNNETARRMKFEQYERAQKYAEFQVISLKKSGFDLNDKQLTIIHKAFAETNGHCDSIIELNLLYDTLSIIIEQAKEMKVEYLSELMYLCKRKFTDILYKMDLFENKITFME